MAVFSTMMGPRSISAACRLVRTLRGSRSERRGNELRVRDAQAEHGKHQQDNDEILRICAFTRYSPTPTVGWIPEFHGAGVEAGRRAASETRISKATVIHDETIEEPPAARNGAVRPVSGMRG